MQNQMNFNRGVVRPIQAFNDAGELLRGYYGNFLVVVFVGVLLIGIGSMIPLAPLTAPLMCGIYLCLFNRIRGQSFEVGTLFKGFEHFGPSFIASLFYSLPMMIVSVISSITIQISMGGISYYIESLKLDKNPKPSAEEVFPVLIGALGSFFGVLSIVIIATMIISIVLRLIIIFAYPLIVEHKMDGMAAVKLSCRAMLGNIFGVVAMMIFEIFLIFAGIMFFYVGVFLVLPFIHAAWFCAYRRVFAPMSETNLWTPQGTSKAGRNLLIGTILMFILSITGLSLGGFFIYQSVSAAIEKAKIDRENKIRQQPNTVAPTSNPTPAPVYPSNNSSSNSKVPNTISGGVLNSKATNLIQPPYPPAAKAVHASGAVNVQVTIDEQGNVISASAVSGHALLRAAAEQAARASKFEPTILSGKAVKVTGIIVYNFVSE
ncbi:MAG: TonB family protein [Pyrinomonadaceae bacterium]|nr:TonB family protein [Pyrinomonadaceae bacterium]